MIPTIDGFIRSASVPRGAGLRFILALVNSRGARRRSRFNRVNHCSVRRCTPHSSSKFILSLSKDAPPQVGFRKAQLASGAFYCTVYLGGFLTRSSRLKRFGRTCTRARLPRVTTLSVAIASLRVPCETAVSFRARRRSFSSTGDPLAKPIRPSCLPPRLLGLWRRELAGHDRSWLPTEMREGRTGRGKR
jgi:hypothetical protein